MAIYFKDKEITNIDSLIPQTDLDITDIWFGDTNIYTVWQVYEGTLPATLNANGDDMRQYQVYGATGGVGDKTINYLDYTQLVAGYTYDPDNGQMILNPDETNRWRFAAHPFIQVTPETTYLRTYNLLPWGNYVNYYDSEKNFISQVSTGNGNPFTVPNNCHFITFVLNIANDRKKYMLTEGTTPPETLVPFGYKVAISTEKPIIYGFHINPNDSNSYTAVTYLKDAVGKTPAAMGSTTFSYGDWANAFFMPRPCMLKYDGTVDYYLNPNDYSQKADGTPSDYNNLAYGGNAMMEFPLIWYKFVQGAESGEGYFYCSNRKVDDSYKCFSNLDCDGNIIEHFYMPIYNGCTYDGKMRSISGLQLSPWSTTAYSSSSTYAVGSKVNYNGRMWECTTAVEAAEAFDPAKWEQFAFNGNTTGTEEITQATANNTTAKVEWYTDVVCDRQLINGLLVLLSKSLDTQGSFGWGIDSGGQTAKEAYVTGSLNDKGLFYGSTTNRNTAVKVFGMENWWALTFHRTAGLVGAADNIYKYKMTYGTSDGSTANGYNNNGTGYLSISNKPATNYIKKMQYGLWGCLPIETGSYSTQFWKDYYDGGTGYALFGGDSTSGANAGMFSTCLRHTASVRYWSISSDLSCKPFRTGNLSKNLESATVTSIYIGSDPLDKDEYVDYQAGKVFRRTAQLWDYKKIMTHVGERYGIIVPNGQYSIRNDTERTIYYVLNYDTDVVNVQIACAAKSTITLNIASTLSPYVRFYIGREDDLQSGVTIVAGSTIPSAEIPYYQPSDPPVALPALPTCDGETIVNYVGESVAPEKVAFKYRKKNF